MRIKYCFVLTLFLLTSLTIRSAQAAGVDLQFDSFTVVSDDGDGKIEPDECVDIAITLRNDGDTTATGVSGTLSSNTAASTVVGANATQSFPDIAAFGGTSTDSLPFKVSVSPSFVCNVPINLSLDVTTDQGSFFVPVTLPTGSVSPSSSTLSDPVDPDTQIKDGRGQVKRAVAVSGVTTIVKVTASIYMTHANDSDLQINLIGPDGTNVDLSSNNGATGDDYGSSCANYTTFDDDAAISITSGTAPFVGSFQPENPLSVFIGKTGAAANGQWRLRVRDRVKNGLNGNLVCWSLTVTYGGVCGDGGVCDPGSQPVVKFSSSSVLDPPDNAPDVNDCFDLSVGLRNDGTAGATTITGASLTTSTPGVFVLQGTSDYSTMAPGATQNNTTAFQVETSPDIPCGTVIDLSLSGTTISSIAPFTPIPFSVPFQITVGTTQTPSQVNGPVAIDDGSSAGNDLAQTISGLTGTVGKVSVALHLTHTFDSDLRISLIGPDNTEVILSNGNGDGGEDYGFDCTDETVFDDAASIPISSATAPFDGIFIPEEALSAFNGKNPNGMWKLHVVDNVSNSEVGNIECWTLNLVTCLNGLCCPTITLDDTLPDGAAGAGYNGTITANGGTGPYTFSHASGTLPAGVILNSDGTLTGTPSAAGTFNFDVTAKDSFGCTGTRSYTVVISCPALTLDDTLPDGILSASYSGTILANGGTAPYSFAQAGGTLPTGLTLNSNGTVTGTPTAPGTFNFDVIATDTFGCSGTRSYTVIITCATITLDPTNPPDGVNGEPYSTLTFTATGGTGSYTFVQTAGALPNGMSINLAGDLSGTPTESGTFNFDVTATDGNGCSDTQSYTLTITDTCLFCDDFEDSILATDWNYIKQSWSETGGNLVGTPSKRKAIVVASPAFAGCTNCSVSATMQTAGGIGNRVWLLSWYIDKKNTVELLMKEENDKFVLKQRVNGLIVRKAKGLITILPNVSYDVNVTFDGTQFHVSVDGTNIINMPAASTPSGTVGFQVKNTTGTFGQIIVN